MINETYLHTVEPGTNKVIHYDLGSTIYSQHAANPDEKTITFVGTTNKYQMKKTLHKGPPPPPNKRVACKKWKIGDDILAHSVQQEIIQHEDATIVELCPLIKQQVDLKLYSYKQQDLKKEMFLEDDFITFAETLQHLRDCNLLCAYCNEGVLVLYENVRDPHQWSLDRIDNDLGHNRGNLVIACLQCNLKRRRTKMSSFLFTKQMKLVKVI
jgi:5-methylcytosine-specific restriction endonuclease McrA